MDSKEVILNDTVNIVANMMMSEDNVDLQVRVNGEYNAANVMMAIHSLCKWATYTLTKNGMPEKVSKRLVRKSAAEGVRDA